MGARLDRAVDVCISALGNPRTTPTQKRRLLAAISATADDDEKPTKRDGGGDSPDHSRVLKDLESRVDMLEKRADDDEGEKKPTLDQVKTMLKECIRDLSEPPEERKKARELLERIEAVESEENEGARHVAKRMAFAGDSRLVARRSGSGLELGAVVRR